MVNPALLSGMYACKNSKPQGLEDNSKHEHLKTDRVGSNEGGLWPAARPIAEAPRGGKSRRVGELAAVRFPLRATSQDLESGRPQAGFPDSPWRVAGERDQLEE